MGMGMSMQNMGMRMQAGMFWLQFEAITLCQGGMGQPNMNNPNAGGAVRLSQSKRRCRESWFGLELKAWAWVTATAAADAADAADAAAADAADAADAAAAAAAAAAVGQATRVAVAVDMAAAAAMDVEAVVEVAAAAVDAWARHLDGLDMSGWLISSHSLAGMSSQMRPG